MNYEKAAAQIAARWAAEPAHTAVEEFARRVRRPIYIVGGAVREALLSRPVHDWDLVLAEAESAAVELAFRLRGRLVVLDEVNAAYRIVLDRERPDYRLDLSELKGDIEADLRQRDLTINALAFEIGTQTLLDPLGGLQDIVQGVLRTPGEENLQADPLRSLRVYRFHSTLGFVIEETTRAWLRACAPLLGEMPGERSGEEMRQLLQPPRAAATLRLMDEDGVLAILLPEIEPARGLVQGGYHHLDVWGHTLETIAQLETILQAPAAYFPQCQQEIAAYLGERGRGPMLLWAALLHDIGKPATMSEDERGWRHFYEHERVSAAMARQILRRFRMPRREVEAIALLIAHHLRPLQLARLEAPTDDRLPQPITRGALERLMRAVHPHEAGLMLLALADLCACRGPATSPDYPERVAPVLDSMLRRVLDWRQEEPFHPLLSGKDLLAAGYQPGPQFRTVLRAVTEAQLEGRIQTKAEALALAEQLLAKERSVGDQLPGMERPGAEKAVENYEGPDDG